MQHIGFSLIDQASGQELQSWPSLPYEITHNGEKRWGAIVGSLLGPDGDAVVVERWFDGTVPFGNPPVASETATFDGSKVVVTRTYGAPNYAAIRAQLISDVKSRAGMLILAYCPQFKQANLTARAAELALLFPGVSGADFDEPYRTEYLAGKAIWDNIKAVRAHSNTLEAQIVACADADLATWQQTGWPTL